MTAGTAQSELNTILLDWGNKVGEWESWCIRLAQVKAKRDNLIAAHKTKARAADPKIASTWADALAEADPEIAQLNLDEMVAEANTLAIRKRLDWFEMRAKAMQSEVSTEREEAKSGAPPHPSPNRTEGYPMTTHFKATRLDGTDFHSGTVNYALALATGKTIKHKAGILNDTDATHYLSVSTKPGDCTGMSWPCRLFEVEPVGDTWRPHKDSLPNKVAMRELRVVRELPPEQVFGKNAAAVVAIVDRYASLTPSERAALLRDRNSTPGWYDAYWRVANLDGLASRAGLEAARRALSRRLNGWGDDDGTAYGAALAVLLRGNRSFSKADYELLTGPWRRVVGPAHPADKLPAKVAS